LTVLTVIMAGGVGERFWPQSRRSHPKQLLDLTGRGSMIRLTLERLDGLSKPEETLIVTNEDQREAILAEVGDRVPADNVIGEPVGQNTAPCIGLAAVVLRRAHGDEPMVVLPADHLVDPVEGFQGQVRAGGEYVRENGSLLTFGIRPTRAETGYGYIRSGEELATRDNARILRAEAFLEKPDAARAQEFVDAGGYYWNSGMFMWTAGAILSEIETHIPELHRVLMEIEAGMGTKPLPDVLKSLYPQAPSISIDYGVMEKAGDVVVLEASFDWNDVGSWEFVREVAERDADGNALVGDHVLVDTRNSTVVARDRVVGVLGLEDVVVVDGGDTVLVCARDRVQEVKKIVQALKDRGRTDLV
jgi:mannose-1-phosphate guanylyltransferase